MRLGGEIPGGEQVRRLFLRLLKKMTEKRALRAAMEE